MLQQCTEIAHSTGRCDVILSVRLLRKKQRGHFTFSERRGLLVKELDLQSEVRGQRQFCLKKLMFNMFLASQFKVKDLDLEYFLFRFHDFIIHRIFSVKIPRLHNSSGSSKIIFSTRTS